MPKQIESVIRITNDTGVIEATVFGRFSSRGVGAEDGKHYNVPIDPSPTYSLADVTPAHMLMRFVQAAEEQLKSDNGSDALEALKLFQMAGKEIRLVVELDAHYSDNDLRSALWWLNGPQQRTDLRNATVGIVLQNLRGSPAE
jgi:hypothetical protein